MWKYTYNVFCVVLADFYFLFGKPVKLRNDLNADDLLNWQWDELDPRPYYMLQYLWIWTK